VLDLLRGQGDGACYTSPDSLGGATLGLRKTDIVIVGAGAAGLWAAATCARSGATTLLLEKTPRTGTKVLASGGTRCNLTTTLDARAAGQLFGPEGARFLAPAFRALSPSKVRERFHEMGVPTKTEPEFDKVFPASDSARDVRDALEREARRAGATIALDQPVQGVEAVDGGWTVSTPSGPVASTALLLCTGGRSYPKTGTTGDGYAWLRSLQLEVVDLAPALVPLTSSAPWVKSLSGISVDAQLRFGKNRRRRPVLFTHVGLSGPGPMDMSVHLTRCPGPVDLLVDLLPDHTWEQVRTTLVAGAAAKGAPRVCKLIKLPRRLVEAVVLQAGIGEPNPRAVDLSRSARHHLVDALKGLAVPITGTTGYDRAEVTAGGLALHQVDRKTMAVRGHPGLYVFGELLDLSGPIGGLNFQAAFATAELAGLAASARVVKH
jgi:predicted Rossmann fold flavoprotein